MTNVEQLGYVSPDMHTIRVLPERGFAFTSGGFEQPEEGAEDNL